MRFNYSLSRLNITLANDLYVFHRYVLFEPFNLMNICHIKILFISEIFSIFRGSQSSYSTMSFVNRL